MYPLPSECPVCHDDLHVTRLACPSCGVVLEGQFALDRLCRLSPEQRHFVELYLRCEGKLNRLQEELGLSYPTVRSRLDEIIQAMGYAVDEAGANRDEGRQEVLERLARKEISTQEALQLLSQRSHQGEPDV